MKRFSFLVLALLLVATGFSFARGAGARGAEVKEISWQGWVTPNLTREFWDDLVAAFEEEHPDIKVKIIEANATITPAADDFIKTRLAADTEGGIAFDYYGPSDFMRMNDTPGTMDHDAPDSPESQLIGAPIREHPDLVARANPISYIGPDTPPFLIVHGDRT